MVEPINEGMNTAGTESGSEIRKEDVLGFGCMDGGSNCFPPLSENRNTTSARPNRFVRFHLISRYRSLNIATNACKNGRRFQFNQIVIGINADVFWKTLYKYVEMSVIIQNCLNCPDELDNSNNVEI